MSVAPCEARWKHSIVDIVMLLRGWTRIVFGPAPVSTIPVLATLGRNSFLEYHDFLIHVSARNKQI